MLKLSSLMKRTLYIIPFLFMTSLSEIFLYTPREQNLSDVLWYSIFGRVSRGEVHTMILEVKSLGFLFLFAILFGSYFSNFFGQTSVLLFTRIKDRRKWGIKKIGILCILSSVYTLMLLLFELAVGIRLVAGWIFHQKVMLTLMAMFGLIFPLLTVICVSVNWMSINHGISMSISVVILALVVLQMIAVFFFDNDYNMVLNPLCFNSALLTAPKLMFVKIIVGLFYMAAVSAGLLLYIEHMDIFEKGGAKGCSIL